MKKLILIAAMAASQSHAQEAASYDAVAVKAHCANEWSTDFAMQKYCQNRIKEGHEKHVKNVAFAMKDGDVLNVMPAIKVCEAEWIPDWAMVTHCVDRNFDGLLEFEAIRQSLPSDIAKTIGSACVAEWPTDFAMQAYCAKRQADAWRDLQ